MTKLAIFVLLFVNATSLWAQEGTSISILFDTDQHVAKASELNRLHSFLKDEDCGFCKLSVAGHTDSDGSDQYNVELSNRRVNFIKNYLSQKFDCFEVEDANHYGESKPLNENAGADQKKVNRRVVVYLNCPKNTEKSEPILVPQDVWSSVVSPPTDGIKKRIYSNEYTTLEAGNGVKVIIEPHAFSMENKPVDITFLECMSRQKAFNMGFTTMTADSLLESGGMFRIIAKIDGRMVEQLRPDAVHVCIPNNGVEDYEGFTSFVSDDYVHWEKRDELKPQDYAPAQAIDRFFGNDMPDYVESSQACNIECRFFWCKVRSFFSKSYKENRSVLVGKCLGQDKDLMKIYDLFKDKLQGEFPDRESFATFVGTNKREDVITKLSSEIPQFDEVSYYVLDLPNARWINCDRFSDDTERTDVVVDEEYNQLWDMRLFFDNELSIMRASKNDDGKILFGNVGIGELATLVIVKKLSDVIYISKESFKIGEAPKVNFRKISLDDLKYVFEKEQSLGSSR